MNMMTHRGVGELLGQGEAVRASGERPGGNYRFRYKTADNDSAFFGNAHSSSDFCIVAPPFYDKAQKAAGHSGYQAE